jgi:enamidase
VLDTPVGSQAVDAFGVLAVGDVPAVAVAVTAGDLRYARSRNTPAPTREITARTA